jgi:hypothetical protein
MYEGLENHGRVKGSYVRMSLFRALISQPVRMLANNPCVGVRNVFAIPKVAHLPDRLCFDLEATAQRQSPANKFLGGEKC